MDHLHDIAYNTTADVEIPDPSIELFERVHALSRDEWHRALESRTVMCSWNRQRRQRCLVVNLGHPVRQIWRSARLTPRANEEGLTLLGDASIVGVAPHTGRLCLYHVGGRSYVLDASRSQIYIFHNNGHQDQLSKIARALRQ